MIKTSLLGAYIKHLEKIYVLFFRSIYRVKAEIGERMQSLSATTKKLEKELQNESRQHNRQQGKVKRREEEI